MEGPVDYSLLEQTATVYRLFGGQVERRVCTGVYLQMESAVTCDEEGLEHQRKFLLILPGEDVVLAPGDRVYDGIGPEITTQQWSSFIPVRVPGLGQIRYVKPYYWQGVLCHTEAGR